MNNLPLYLIPLAPAAAALVNGVLALARRGDKTTPYIGILATATASCISILAQPGPAGVFSQRFTWLRIPPAFAISLGVHVDALTWVMLGVVCVVSLLVQVYSIGYMAGEAGYGRYFAYLSLFTASMLGLVVADNLFQLYVCWELVGICSYLLIGFWWSKPSAANAAKKAFVVTRFGDVGFLLGVLLLASTAGSFQFDDAGRAVRSAAAGHMMAGSLVGASTFVWLVPVLLFCGAIGKSAQFPLHVWLPDAMEGPTPVSALIHAATMVAAGVYMVARLFPIFAASAIAMGVVLGIGTITAFMAATIAVTQTDIKKVMAYSTISQLGYMMVGLGAGSPTAGIFHLATHAMFKALLFLTAGSVIHALHHSQDPNDMRHMGGLARRMPATAITCGIGVLALAGIPPFAGFWSKDAILGAAWERSHEDPLALLALAVGVAVAGITAFYATRMWLMTFWGQPRSEEAAHAHEPPAVMTVPLWVLAIASVGLGGYLEWGGRFAAYLGRGEAAEAINWGLASFSTLIALAGMTWAARLYAVPELDAAAEPVRRLPAVLYRTFANLWGMDAFWNRVGAAWTLAAGRTVAWIDRNIVDRYVAHSPAWLCARGGLILRRTANGQAQSYAAVFVTAVVVLVVLVLLYEQQAGSAPSAQAAAHALNVAGVTRGVWR
ncbi:MAG: NADH-quinone oxidoreductase subunit L [Chthonomonadales bacterium]